MKINFIPVAKIEKRVIDALKNENLTRFAGKYKVQLLSDQSPTEHVPKFQDILNKINHTHTKLPGRPWQINYKYKKSEGVTKIYLHNDFIANRPTIIFHHGLGRLNPLHLKIFANNIIIEKFNVFSIKAAHHDSVDELSNKFLNSFVNISTCFCASVLAIDEIVDFHKNNSNQKVAVVGVSMGGTITALHYFFFDTADFYFPIISYPNFGEIILDKNVKEFVANYDKLVKNKSIKKVFAIPDDLKNRPKDKIFPILADSDELVNFEKALNFWKGYEITTFNVGHNTIFIKTGEIRKLIISELL